MLFYLLPFSVKNPHNTCYDMVSHSTQIINKPALLSVNLNLYIRDMDAPAYSFSFSFHVKLESLFHCHSLFRLSPTLSFVSYDPIYFFPEIHKYYSQIKPAQRTYTCVHTNTTTTHSYIMLYHSLAVSHFHSNDRSSLVAVFGKCKPGNSENDLQKNELVHIILF